jgi:hypothetical protein
MKQTSITISDDLNSCLNQASEVLNMPTEAVVEEILNVGVNTILGENFQTIEVDEETFIKLTQVKEK